MRAHRTLPKFSHAGIIPPFTHLFICCVQALQHQQASSAFSLGSEFPTSGKLPVSPSRIHDKHKHLYPRRFFSGFSILLFFLGGGNRQKGEPYQRLRFGNMDHGLTAFPNIISTTVPSSSSFFMYRSSACLLLFIAMPSIAAGCADYRSVVLGSLGVA
jgi:hypothetical protein